jgi:hypothetical protein
MGIELRAEQLTLRDTLRDFFASSVGRSQLRSYVDAHQASAPAALELRQYLWKSFQQFDFASFFSLSEEQAAGTGFAELAILAKESGRALCPEPFYEALFASSYLPKRYFDASDYALLAGSGISLAALAESPGLLLVPSHIECPFPAQGNRPSLSAELVQVDTPLRPQGYLLPVHIKPHKPQLALLCCAQNLIQEASPSLDLTRAVTTLKAAEAQLQLLSPKLAPILHEARILKAAELAGLAAFVVELTTEYLKSREQFGKPIGSFQALQHMIADMYLASEALDALVDFAVWAAEDSPKQLALASFSAISYACQHVPEICEKAIQLHGGLGFTWEYDLHLYLRRAKKAQLLCTPSEASERQLLAAARRAG